MESPLHLAMKESASRELEREGYSVFLEPSYSPSPLLSWGSYRPDVFGMRTLVGSQGYAMVECETRPSERRLVSKNFRSIQFQTRLNLEPSLRLILVIPRGTLRRLDSGVRRSWETWVYSASGIQMFPLATPSRDGFPFIRPARPGDVA